jgi:hypothetical protein
MPVEGDFSIVSVQARNGDILLTILAVALCMILVFLGELLSLQRARYGRSSTASFSS